MMFPAINIINLHLWLGFAIAMLNNQMVVHGILLTFMMVLYGEFMIIFLDGIYGESMGFILDFYMMVLFLMVSLWYDFWDLIIFVDGCFPVYLYDGF